MKIISTVFFFFLVLSSSVLADDRHTWTTGDSLLQSALIGLIVVDWHQTREFTSKRQKYPTKYESNPLLKAHPSAREVNSVIVGCILVHTGIAYLLPKPYRTIWQSLWLGVEVDAVYANYRAGITFSF